MKKIEIYDPAMCCSSGVCGPSVNPELIRISSVVHNLKAKGFVITRYNLLSEPEAFVSNHQVAELLNEKGPNVLPIIILDSQVVKEYEYPTNEELMEWTGLAEDELVKKPKIRLEINVKQERKKD